MAKAKRSKPKKTPQAGSRRRRFDAAVDAVFALDTDTADAITGVLTTHRAIHGEPEQGALRAACIAVRSVLGAELDPDEKAIAKRLAAVARGVRGGKKSNAAEIRRVARIVDEVMGRTRGARVLSLDGPAVTIVHRVMRTWGKAISRDAVERALKYPRHRQIANVAKALGCFPASTDFDALDHVREVKSALRQ